MKHNLLKSLIISVILLTGVSNAWAWYVPGTIHETRWDIADNNMHEDNKITFYAVPAGTYEFRLSNGSTLSGHQCINTSEGIQDIGKNGDNTKFTITATKDITITVVDAQNWNVSVVATDPTYHIKAKWDGTNWSWKEFNNQGDGTYSLLNTYTNSREYNYIKISSDDDTHKYYKDNATLINSPATGNNCIYTFNPSNGALEIRKCNTVKFPYHIYFDNSIANWPSNKLQFVVGHASYGRGHDLTNVPNTKLYHVHITNYDWPDAGYYAIVSEPTTFGGDGWSRKKLIDNADHYSAAYLDPLNIEQNQSYLFKTEDANDGTPISITKKTQSSELNTTQTVQYVIAEYAGTPAIMNSGTTPAIITMSSYKFESGRYDAVIAENATMNAKETTYSKTFTAAHTATTTVTVSEIDNAYQFDGWYTAATGGTLLSPDQSYTYYPTETKTIYARFSEKPCIVTLHPVLDSHGNSGYGHFIVDYKGTRYTSSPTETIQFDVAPGSTITIVESQHQYPDVYNGDLAWRVIGGKWEDWKNINNPINYPIEVNDDIEIADNFVVRKEAVDRDITPNAGVYVFLRIPKSLEHNNEGGWNHGQWDDNSLHENLGYPKNKFANFVYLKATSTPGHEVRGSKDADRGCADAGQKAGHFLMDTVHIADDQFSTYYCIITDSCWSTVKFERKHADSDDGEGQITCADVQNFPGGKNNCFTITGRKNDGAFTGEWGPAPTCTVKMGFNNIGRYGFKDCYGTIHYRTPSSDEYFEVPCGGIEVLEGEPGNDAYTGTVGLRSIDDKKTNILRRFYDYPEPNGDNYIILTQDTMLDDLFATKNAHVLYVGIPNDNENLSDWHIDNTDDIFVWKRAPYNDYGLGLAVKEDKFVIDNITYYKYTLPAGLCNFQIQRKTGDNGTEPICKSRGFAFQIPLTEYNCFMLDGSKDGNEYDGYWTKVPKPNVGDYRVLYAEKELIKTHEEGETEDWETAFRTVYEHPSDIIPKGIASKTISLHINTSQKRDDKTVHPMVILQQFQQIEGNTYKWANLQAHTVLPLKATGNMGMLPGRKKAFGDLPFYDNGIEAIKNDTTYSSRRDGLDKYKGSGVWNFTVTQGLSQVTLNVGNTTRYTGKYYIRTEALPDDGWNNYTDNLMTYSDYADYNSGFSHYFCKWLLVGNNVKFTIANDHAQSISDPLYGDATDLWGDPIDFQMVGNDQVLNEDANVRFAWYEMNNFVHRAYLGGSTHVQDRFLIVKDEEGQIFSHPQGTALLAGGDGSPRYGLKDNEEIFRDDANWIYHADIQIYPGSTATVIAQHYGKEQTFIKERTLVYGDDLGSMTNKYPVRLLYDFKINRLITGYIPNGNNSTHIEAFTTNLMLIRKHHEQATQLLFNSNAKTTQGAYGVMTFERDFLRNPNKTNKERAAYFISFPFDVKISDVFGFGQFYKHWFIQYYDGEARAKNGLWADTDTYWKHITDPNTVLKAYQGYALLFSLSNIEKSGVLDASKEISLYFPSTDNNIGNITDVNPETSVEVPAHVCTIERENRKVKDSNWNLIGVPAYADVSDFANNTFKDPYNNEVYFYWKRDVATDEYEVCDADDSRLLTFQTMHAYMLQYAGVINWKAHTMSQHDYSNKLIARRNTEQEASHTLRITLNQADKKLDQTYVRLQEEDATADFDMNKDQYKIRKAKANIYSLIQNAVGQIEAGANVLPLQTTVVPLGVIIKTAGEYTFSMPDGTAGITAELIDYQTNTRTNLLLDNYTVTLPAGTNNSRFALSLQPDKTVTSVDNIGNEATGDKVKKFIIDGKLYLQKDGVLYDAQGHAL